MDSLELSAALDAARAGEKYWRELSELNAETIAGLREENDHLRAFKEKGWECAAGYEAAMKRAEAGLEATRAQLTEAVRMMATVPCGRVPQVPWEPCEWCLFLSKHGAGPLAHPTTEAEGGTPADNKETT